MRNHSSFQLKTCAKALKKLANITNINFKNITFYLFTLTCLSKVLG